MYPNSFGGFSDKATCNNKFVRKEAPKFSKMIIIKIELKDHLEIIVILFHH